MSNPYISVIMPARNASRFIDHAIDSIVGQSLGDFEFIIIDDGSTDATPKMARHHAENDARIIVVNCASRGLVAALQTGLHLAKGQFVARMDSDDIAERDRLQIQAMRLERDPALVAIGGQIQRIDDSGQYIGRGHYPVGRDACRRHLRTRGSPFCHPAVMMRSQAIKAVGGYRDKYLYAEDYDLWLRLSEIGDIDNVADPVLSYRVHGTSTSFMHAQQQASATGLAVIAAIERSVGGSIDTTTDDWAGMTASELASRFPESIRSLFELIVCRTLLVNGAPASIETLERLARLDYQAAEQAIVRAWCDMAFLLTRGALQAFRAGRLALCLSILSVALRISPVMTIRELATYIS